MYTIISCIHKMSGSIRYRNTGTGSLSHLTCCFSPTSLMQPCAHKSFWGDFLSTVHANVRLFQKCIIITVISITTTNSDLIVVDARVIAHAADSTQLFQSRVFTGFDLLAILVPEHTTKTCTYIYIYIHMQIQPVTYTHIGSSMYNIFLGMGDREIIVGFHSSQTEHTSWQQKRRYWSSETPHSALLWSPLTLTYITAFFLFITSGRVYFLNKCV